MADAFKWAALDLETTGLSSVRDHVCEAALVTLTGTAPATEWSSLLRTGTSCHRRASRIHGLKDGHLRLAPAPGRVIAELHQRLREVEFVVAHNAAFDLAFLGEAFRGHGFGPPGPAFYCSLRLAKQILPQSHSFGLGALQRELHLPAEPRHRALGDARTVGALFLRLLSARGGDLPALLVEHGPPLSFKWSPTRRAAQLEGRVSSGGRS